MAGPGGDVPARRALDHRTLRVAPGIVSNRWAGIDPDEHQEAPT